MSRVTASGAKMHLTYAFLKMTNFSKNQGKKLNQAQKFQIHLNFRILTKNLKENTAKKSCKKLEIFFRKLEPQTFPAHSRTFLGNSYTCKWQPLSENRAKFPF